MGIDNDTCIYVNYFDACMGAYASMNMMYIFQISSFYGVKYSICTMRLAARVCRSFTSIKDAVHMPGRHSKVRIGGSKSGDLSATDPVDIAP